MTIVLDNKIFNGHKCGFKKNIREDVIKMVCTTVKENQDCSFMTKKGCGFNGGACHKIIDECVGCQRVAKYNDGEYCMVFPDPSAKWRIGNCSMATHLITEPKKGAAKINPIKASKRMGGR